AGGHGSDDRVVAPLEPQRAVGEFGGEGGIPAPDIARSQERGQHQVGVGVLLLHGTQRLPDGEPGRVGTAGAFPRFLGTARPAAAGPLPPRLAALVLPIGPSLGAGGIPPAAHWVAAGCWSKDSPPVNRAPRAQSAARIQDFPGGLSSSSCTGWEPVPTSTVSPSSLIRPAGSGRAPGSGCTGPILNRCPSRV